MEGCGGKLEGGRDPRREWVGVYESEWDHGRGHRRVGWATGKREGP